MCVFFQEKVRVEHKLVDADDCIRQQRQQVAQLQGHVATLMATVEVLLHTYLHHERLFADDVDARQ